MGHDCTSEAETMKSHAAWAVWGIIAGGVVCTIVCTVFLPYGSDRTETVLHAGRAIFVAAGLILAVGIGNVAFFRNGLRPSFDWPEWSEFLKGYALPSITLAMLSMAAFVINVERSQAVSRLTWEFTGTVAEKYRSNNHFAPSVVVRDEHGNTRVFEGVDGSFWQRLAMGDSVSKQKRSAFGRLNQEKIRIVPRHWLDGLVSGG
jgi:hypothetical protein